MYKYFKRIDNADHISSRRVQELSDEIIKSLSAPNNILDPSLDYLGAQKRVKLNGS